MKFTIEGPKFREAVKSVKTSRWRHEAALIIEARGKGVVEVSGWSPDLWIAVKVQGGKVAKPGRITLNYTAAAKAIAAMSGDIFEVDTADYHSDRQMGVTIKTLVIQSGDTAIRVTAPPGYEPPTEAPYPKHPTEMQLHVGALAEVARFASNDESRPILCAVAVQEGGVYVGTDSYRLANVEVPAYTTRPKEFLIPRSTIEAVAPLLPAKFVQAKVNEANILFEYGDVRIYSSLTQGQYPSWRNLMPDPEAYTSDIKVQGIGDIVRRMATLSRAVIGDARVAVRADDGRVLFHAVDTEGNEVTIRADGTVDGMRESVAFNPRFLADFIEGTHIGTMFGMDSLKPWGIHEEADYCFGAKRSRIIMPTRIR